MGFNATADPSISSGFVRKLSSHSNRNASLVTHRLQRDSIGCHALVFPEIESENGANGRRRTRGGGVPSEEEAVVHRILGLLGLCAVATAAVTGGGPAPNKVDLAADFQEFGLTPLQQGDRGDCSLFAITALVELELAKASPNAVHRLSEEFLIWAAHAASATKADDQAMFFEAVHGLNVYGVCASALMPYAKSRDLRRKPSDKALLDARARSERWKVHWIKRWDVKSGLSAVELAQIKQALAHGHAVACGLRWPKKLDGHEILHVPAAGAVEDGHSIAFTGYQDDARQPGGGVLFFRNSWGPEWGNRGYGVMSYAYATAYANDAVWLELGAPHSEKPHVRHEAESLPILARGQCECNPQDMKKWGRGMWSRGEQLFCGAKDHGFIELGFEVRQAGKYRVRVLATAAPDYGKVRIALDGNVGGADFDLYCGRVSPSGSLELGRHALGVGQHHLRCTVTGKNAASADYVFGIDAIDLLD
jgi:Papain family cysteine protease